MDDPCVARTQNANWLPEAQWLKRHEGFLVAKAANPDPQLVFVGDSITEGWGGNPDNRATWLSHFDRFRPLNLGISGDETQHVLWRLEHGELDAIRPRALVLLIGTNNIGNSGMTGSQTVPGVQKVVRTIRTLLPATRLLHLAVFPRGRTAADPLRREVGVLNAQLAAAYRQTPDPMVTWVDLAGDFLRPDGTLPEELFPDALHLTPAAYKQWAALLAPRLAALAAA